MSIQLKPSGPHVIVDGDGVRVYETTRSTPRLYTHHAVTNASSQSDVLLPLGIRWVSADKRVWLIEQPPMTRRLSVIGGRAPIPIHLPWMYFIVNTAYCRVDQFMRANPIQSLDDVLEPSWLPNVHANGTVCQYVYGNFNGKHPEEFLRDCITTFYNQAFARDYYQVENLPKLFQQFLKGQVWESANCGRVLRGISKLSVEEVMTAGFGKAHRIKLRTVLNGSIDLRRQVDPSLNFLTSMLRLPRQEAQAPQLAVPVKRVAKKRTVKKTVTKKVTAKRVVKKAAKKTVKKLPAKKIATKRVLRPR